MASQLARTKRLLLISAFGVALLLLALPAPAESRASGYPVTIDIRKMADGGQASPLNFAVQPGRRVVLVVRNHTGDLHTFAIPAIGLNVAVPARQTVRFTFVAPRYGIYRWHCVPCAYGMHGKHHMGGKVYAWISPDLDLG